MIRKMSNVSECFPVSDSKHNQEVLKGLNPLLLSLRAFALIRNIQMKSQKLTFVLLNPDMPCLCKQCRSRSVGF